MHIQDQVQLSDFAKTAEGFMVLKNSRLARTGIQIYRASEMGEQFKDRDPGDLIRVYRPPDEVFSEDALASLAARPITIEHRGGFVNSENAKDLVVGHLGDTIGQDGNLVTGVVHVTHAEGIAAIEDGKIELSVGYDLDLEIKAGTTPEGEAFDAIQKNIRANHVALVSRGRGGMVCRVHDGANSDGKNCKCEDDGMTMKIVDCGGAQVEMSDAAAIALTSLTDKHVLVIESKDSEIKTLADTLADAEAKLAKADARADEAEAKLKDAEAKNTPEALDAAARERSKLVEDAHKLAPDVDCKTLDSIGIKRAALEVQGVDLKDKSDSYIDSAFEVRVDYADSDPGTAARMAKDLANTSRTQSNDSDDDEARAAYLKRQSNAYKGEN